MGREHFARLKADTIVVHPEVRCMRVRYVDRYQRNLRRGDLICNHGRRFLLDLELNYEVHTILDEFFRVPHGGGGVVAIVEDQQVHADRGGCGRQALCHLDREGHVNALPAKPEA